MTFRRSSWSSLVALLLLAPACDSKKETPPTKTSSVAPAKDSKAAKKEGDKSEKVMIDLSKPAVPSVSKKPFPKEAPAFIERVDKELRTLWTMSSTKAWAHATNINEKTEAALTSATAKVMEYETRAILATADFKDYKGDADVERQLGLLRLTSTLPAPDDDAKRTELAAISSRMDGTYAKGKVCPEGGAEKDCQDLGALSDVLAKSEDPNAILDAWKGWRTVSVPMRKDYERFVELGNEGAKAIGFRDMGELWRSRYDMTPDAFEQEVDRLWGQVEPLYEALHCHVRAKLTEKYGEDVVPKKGGIPAHLTGNMWAQDWAYLYPMVEPFPGEPSLDVTEGLTKQKYDEIKMVKMGESFFTSMGLNPLPDTFWERSLFKKPDGREVQCHASAWDVGLNNDLRIKMCVKINHEDLVTIHHELGHNYYYNNYFTLPVLYQSGAHDGFHEAIGDAIALSITPSYLKEVGLLEEAATSDKAVINKQMQDALAKVAFLPFGKMIDQWRWDVFSGKVGPDQYNAHWWKLRKDNQGVVPPGGEVRGEEFFDPGAKYHIPANTPYARYFLAHILQFQFHKAMCDAAGHDGPLHTCSVYGSKEAGTKLAAMLAMGASKPWPDALEALTGTREMDAAALLEYFGPLEGYLKKENKGRSCGW